MRLARGVRPPDRDLVPRMERQQQVREPTGRGDGLPVEGGDGVALGQPTFLRGRAGHDGAHQRSRRRGVAGAGPIAEVPAEAPAKATTKLNQNWNRSRGFGRDGEASLNIDGDVGEHAVVHMSDQRFGDNRDAGNFALIRPSHLPSDFGHIWWNAAIEIGRAHV